MGPHATLHPTDETLGAFGLGKLDEESAESVIRHLEECPDCERRIAEMSGDSFLGRLRKVHGASAVQGELTSSAASSKKVAAPPAETLPPGLADHPDYKVVRELGRGGMGVVYLAENTLMGRLEVLKVVGGHLVNRPSVRDRFLREIQSAAKLQHKNVVAAYSAIRLGDAIVLTMEYVEGQDLAKLVKSGGPLPVANACYFAYQAALGLQHAHERGMVHRDIKPANLILAREGKRSVVKVLDFGLAKVTSEKSTDSDLTSEGQMLGTPDYVAPEQIRDAQKADIRADIYSLGCTMYYLLTGGPPFRGEHLWDVYQAHFSMDASPLNLVRPEIPSELASLVAKMLAKDPGRRFQTPGEVAQALMSFFRPAANIGTGSSPEISRVGQLPSATATDRPAAPRPAKPRPAPVPTIAAPSEAAPEADVWRSLLETEETERSSASLKRPTVVARGRGRRNRWAWPTLAAGALLVVLLASVVFRTPNGTLVFDDLHQDAVVTSDGNRITAEWPDGRGKGHAQVSIPAGKHQVQVEVDGVRVTGGEVVIESGRVKWFEVKYVEHSPKTEVVLPQAKVALTPAFDRKQFTIDAGRWIVQGDELSQSDPRIEWTFLNFGDEQWTDYDFSADVMRISGMGNVGLVVRASDPDNLMVFVNSSRDTTESHILDRTKGTPQVVTSATCPFEGHKWYTARVQVRGREIAGTLHDGHQEFVNLKVNDDIHPRGRVGFRIRKSAYRFKNIKVTAPDGKILWEGPPAIDPPNRPAFAHEDGFTPIFNGKDLTGWQVMPSQRYIWGVENGVLVGSSPKFGILYSRRDDYKDFHLRAEVRVSHGGNSGVLFRVPMGGEWDHDYEAQLGGDHGALCAHRKFIPPLFRPSMAPELWFTFEVIAEGNRVVTKVDGKTVADYRDGDRPSSRGRLGLECCPVESRPTRVEFRKFEIKEL